MHLSKSAVAATLISLLLLHPLFSPAAPDTPISGDDWGALTDGRALFNAACATCHGADGRGAPPSITAFDIPLPDFTDCSFASREPRADWVAVAHQGGPVRVFDAVMPAFGEALTEPQIEAAVDHLKSFCKDPRWPDGALNLPRALVTTKAFPEDEVVWTFSATTEEPVSLVGTFILEKRVGARHQLEVALPVGAQQIAETSEGDPDHRWDAGLGDVTLGWKSVLWHSRRAGAIGSLGAEIGLPVGDQADGFGRGHFALEPFLAVGQILPRLGFFQIQAGAALAAPLSEADPELFWRLALGRTFQAGGFGRVLAPMVEVLGQAALGETTETAWDIAPQLFVTLSTRQHVIFSAGVRIPLDDFHGRPILVMAYLLWDTFDGGFLEGW